MYIYIYISIYKLYVYIKQFIHICFYIHTHILFFLCTSVFSDHLVSTTQYPTQSTSGYSVAVHTTLLRSLTCFTSVPRAHRVQLSRPTRTCAASVLVRAAAVFRTLSGHVAVKKRVWRADPAAEPSKQQN